MVAVVGTFDGVHCGHQAVLRRARRFPGPLVALTFDPHPRTLFGERVGLLDGVGRRRELLRRHGADEVVVLAFDREFAGLTPEQFIESTLRPLGVSRVVGGEGFAFGNRRAGTAATLRANGIPTSVVPLVGGVSSSRIRELMIAGDVASARAALGRPPELHLEPIDSEAAPTLRLADDALLAPAAGRYEASRDGQPLIVAVDDGDPPRAHIGRPPASLDRVGAGGLRLELHARVGGRSGFRDRPVAAGRVKARLDAPGEPDADA